MNVAISAQGSELTALVDPRFGRARWILIINTETGAFTAIDNSANVDASGGAGVQAATTVASQGANALITGNVGPNAHKVLAAAGIAIHTVGNGVRVCDALDSFRNGDLPVVEQPTVSGHWA